MNLPHLLKKDKEKLTPDQLQKLILSNIDFAGYILFDLQVSENILEFYIDNTEDVDWDTISKDQHLSESFIRKHKDNLIWDYISSCQDLSEELMRENLALLNWTGISINQKLSENFLREFSSKIDWDMALIFQTMSKDFENKVKLFL